MKIIIFLLAFIFAWGFEVLGAERAEKFNGEKNRKLKVREGARVGEYLVNWDITLEEFQKINPWVTEKTLKAGQSINTPALSQEYQEWLLGLAKENETLANENERMLRDLEDANEKMRLHEGSWLILQGEGILILAGMFLWIVRKFLRRRRPSIYAPKAWGLGAYLRQILNSKHR